MSPGGALPTGQFCGPNLVEMEPAHGDRRRLWEYYDRRAQEGQRTVRHAAEYWTGLGVKTTELEIETEGLELRRLLRSLTRATFAEVGAGPGTFSTDFAGRGLVLDQSDAALRVLLADSPTIPAVRADACRLPFPDRALERVIATHIYGLLRKPERGSFLAEAHRVADELIVLDAARPIGVPAEQTQLRTLSGGGRFEIYRRHFDAEELAQELGGRPVFAGRFYVLVIA
jgi:Methyltransferase domain